MIQGSKRHQIPDPDLQHCNCSVCSPEIHAVLHDGIVYEVGVVHSLPHVHHTALDGEVDLVPPQSLHGFALKKVNNVEVTIIIVLCTKRTTIKSTPDLDPY